MADSPLHPYTHQSIAKQHPLADNCCGGIPAFVWKHLATSRTFFAVLVCGLMAAVYGVPDSDEAAVASGIDLFGLDVYKILKQNLSNVLFSPASAEIVLAMLSMGAVGQTFTEISNGLRLPRDKRTIKYGFQKLSLLEGNSSNVTIQVANKLYIDNNFKILSQYRHVVQKFFSADVLNINFKQNPEESRVTINNWVANETRDKIQNLLPPGSVTSSTASVLVNTLYFKGKWEKPFNANDTREEIFYSSGNRNTTVQMMHQTDSFFYADLPDCQVVQLLYGGGDFSMLVVLPKEKYGADNLEIDFTTINNSLTRQRVDLSLPKFKLEMNIPMDKILQQLGMQLMYTNSSNFSQLSKEKVQVSSVIQKIYLEVFEEGTEAAAATGVVISTTAVLEGMTTFIADHTFLIALLHRPSNAVLFLGKYSGPP